MHIRYDENTLQWINDRGANTLKEHLGIEFSEIAEDYIKGRMPVDKRTIQPLGLLHGGASLSLAETLGSVGATLCVDHKRKICLGIAISANHLRPVRSGYVYGIAKPIHVGERTQVWEIQIQDQEEVLICVARLTLAVLDRDPPLS